MRCNKTLNDIFIQEKADRTRIWKAPREERKNFIEELTRLIRKPNTETGILNIILIN